MHVPSAIANSTTGDDGDLSVNGIKPRRNLEVFGNRITFALTSNDDSSSSLTDPIFVSSFDSSFVACATCACSSSSCGVSSY